jgi:hypothetical protein
VLLDFMLSRELLDRLLELPDWMPSLSAVCASRVPVAGKLLAL